MAANTSASNLSGTPGAATASNLLKNALPWWVQYTRWRQTSREEAVAAERLLFSLRGTEAPTEAVDVPLSDGNFMHTVLVRGEKTAAPVVCVPGYGAGAGFFWKNLSALSGSRLALAVDPLGTGLSSRPPFKAVTTREAEEFFVGSLSEWRRKMGLEQMVLVGHSLGGYLAAVYALKHPEHVKHLVLVSPAGIPEMPRDWEPAAVRRAASPLGLLWRAAKAAWEGGLTPGAVTRALGPWGPGLVHSYVSRRFRTTGEGLAGEEEVAAFRDYQYHILAQDGSGEHALRHILQPFAWARDPLEHRMAPLRVPVTFVYGDKDWMLGIDEQAPHRALARMPPPAAPAPLDRRVVAIKDSGHYLFIDRPGDFHNVLEQICKGHV